MNPSLTNVTAVSGFAGGIPLSVCITAGPVAQWIRHRSTEPEIPGSSPGRVTFVTLC